MRVRKPVQRYHGAGVLLRDGAANRTGLGEAGAIQLALRRFVRAPEPGSHPGTDLDALATRLLLSS